jgi:phospholipase A1
MQGHLFSLIFACGFATLLSVDGSHAIAGAADFAVVATAEETFGAGSALEQHLAREEEAIGNAFAITPLRPNYILPVAYNWRVNSEPYQAAGESDWLQPVEMKFQLSLKTRLAKDLFGDDGDLYAAYTQLSLWQAYNANHSSPFRETNYEPEIFLTFDTSVKLLGLRNRLLTLGLVHQSNGRSESMSRSWNRAYVQFVLDRGPFCLLLKPWYRIPESDEDDNNPDIDKYLGNGEIRAVYLRGEQEFAVLLRSNFRPSDHKGATEFSWSFPLYGKTRGYIQYFYGYGESMIDYNAVTNRLGVGFLLTDWL